MEERVSFGLQFQRDKSPSRPGDIAAKYRHDHKQQMLEVEKAQLQLQTQSRESDLEME